jgi:hypothetical protein
MTERQHPCSFTQQFDSEKLSKCAAAVSFDLRAYAAVRCFLDMRCVSAGLQKLILSLQLPVTLRDALVQERSVVDTFATGRKQIAVPYLRSHYTGAFDTQSRA